MVGNTNNNRIQQVTWSTASLYFSAGLAVGLSSAWLAWKVTREPKPIPSIIDTTSVRDNSAPTTTQDQVSVLEHEIHVLETPTQESLEQKEPCHGQELPAFLTELIPLREKQVLAFILTYIRERNHAIPGILVNGGYVRDLLLGKLPDDLDISLCLRDCPPDVSVEAILADLEDFPNQHPEFDIVEVKSTTIVSDESKNKQIDTAKATITMKCSTSVEVDIMPTIGAESYDDSNNRIPTRDHRGTPEEDALRRDLTIGCLFLSVTLTSSGGLKWVLLDYYGGLPDLKSKLLRSPFPHDVHPKELVPQVIRSPNDCALWDEIKLSEVFRNVYDMDISVSWDEREECTKVVCPSPLTVDGGPDHPCQPVWWIKVLEDDPLRIVRTFRFAGKLGFEIHHSFWWAIPFALQSLKTKVAGSRKYTELIKLAKLGKDRMLQLFHLAFVQTFHGPNGKEQDRLAPYLFGGNDSKQVAHYMSGVTSFDWSKFVALYELVPLSLTQLSTSQQGSSRSAPDSLFGVLLAIAICCCTFEPSSKQAELEMAAQAPKTKAKFQGRPLLLEFNRCVEGLCGSNDMRAAGEDILNSRYWLLQHAKEPSLGWQFASVFEQGARSRDSAGSAGPSFPSLCAIWDALKLGKTPKHYSHNIVVKLLEVEDPVVAASVRESLGVLRRRGPNLKGSCLLGVSKEEVPQHLRGSMITALEVFARVVGYRGDVIDTDALRSWLQEYDTEDGQTMFHLLTKEWHDPAVDGCGRLKEQYSIAGSKGSKSKSKKAKKKSKN